MALRIEVAQRTSPTNIGLWLTSALAARDFGYLTADDFLDALHADYGDARRLERYEGHLLNWYDTRTLQPLTPRYVSTVDSGNLIASLWVLEQRLPGPAACAADRSRRLRGLADTLAALREVCGTTPPWRCRFKRCDACCAVIAEATC